MSWLTKENNTGRKQWTTRMTVDIWKETKAKFIVQRQSQNENTMFIDWYEKKDKRIDVFTQRNYPRMDWIFTRYIMDGYRFEQTINCRYSMREIPMDTKLFEKWN